jgi:hypothetical protein
VTSLQCHTKRHTLIKSLSPCSAIFINKESSGCLCATNWRYILSARSNKVLILVTAYKKQGKVLWRLADTVASTCIFHHCHQALFPAICTCLIIISSQSNVRRMLPVWLYQTPQYKMIPTANRWSLLDLQGEQFRTDKVTQYNVNIVELFQHIIPSSCPLRFQWGLQHNKVWLSMLDRTWHTCRNHKRCKGMDLFHRNWLIWKQLRTKQIDISNVGIGWHFCRWYFT